MKKFIEISILEYVRKYIQPEHILERPQITTEEIIRKQIIPIDNIKKVYDTTPTQLLIYDDNENELKYVNITNTYDEIKSKMGGIVC